MFGARLKEARTAKGLTQRQLGDLVGVVDSMITRIERGTRQASAPLIGQLAEALGVTTDWLINGKKSA
jgi:transcriptional regulator with XRE-family HTH domain